MRTTNSITGKAPAAVLQLVSSSAVIPSTFVLREVRQLRELGFEMVIGQLRPVLRDMNLSGFDELADIVVKPRWLSLECLSGILYYAMKQPNRLWRYVALIFRCAPEFKNLIKMIYVLFASVILAYRHRVYRAGHVRAHFLHTEALAAYFVSGLLQVPYSITVHTVVVRFHTQVVREVLQKASFLVADTHQVYEFLQLEGVPCERIRLIRNGLRLDELTFQHKSVISTPPIVLAAGYLVPKKGFEFLLKACHLLRQRRVRFRCLVVGDGVERSKLNKLISGLGLESEVEMLGDLSFEELKKRYYHAAIFVMPSVTVSDGATDGLPTVVLESMACGTPVIGTRTAAIPEVVFDGKTGLLVPAGDPEAIADRIELLLSEDALRSSLAREGRHLIEREFDLQRNSQTLAGLILSHLNIPGPSVLSILDPEVSLK